jgi:signal transduction histidine kinase/DNA-binding response OmpR family regulator
MAQSALDFGYWRVDYADKSVFWSPQVYDIMGVPDNVPPSFDWIVALHHPDDRAAISEAMNRARETGVLAPLRFRIVRADGSIAHVVANGVLLTPTVMLGIVQDITSDVGAERALIVARDQAQAAERAKAEFLSVLSHEIRAPMAGVLSTIDQLRDNPPEAQRRRLFDTLSQSTSALTEVLDNLLDLSRVDAGRVVLESRGFDLRALVRTTVDLFQGSAHSKSLRLDVHGLDGAPAIVRGDSARVQQIISNLISNAIKFTETGRISITASMSRSTADTDYWMVVVQDSGIGIGQDALGRIFSRFEQVDAARTRLQGGTGLGLAISQQLAEAMGGSIAVSSDPGRGSTFSVELPFAKGTGAVGEGAAPAAARTTGPLRILLAEDNPVNRRLMTALLTRQGHEVVAVEDGRKAVHAMTEQRFDLILMDMQMPELNGIDATRAIRALDPPASGTPILAISADAQPERRRIYSDAGVDHFLPKPIVSGQLLEMVEKMRRGAISAHEQPADHFDRERLNWLVEQAGYDEAAVLMKMLLFDVTDRPGRIAAAVRAMAWDLAMAEADALRTLLDNFGNFALSRLLSSVARQCGQKSCPPAIIEELQSQAAALATMLQNELGGMPSPIAKVIDNVVEPNFPQRGQDR